MKGFNWRVAKWTFYAVLALEIVAWVSQKIFGYSDLAQNVQLVIGVPLGIPLLVAALLLSGVGFTAQHVDVLNGPAAVALAYGFLAVGNAVVWAVAFGWLFRSELQDA